MKEFIEKNWFKLGIIIAVLILAYSIYYSLVVRPERQAMQAENLRIENQANLQSCLDIADTTYSINWSTACHKNAERIKAGYSSCIKGSDGYAMTASDCRSIWGTPDDSANCSLPNATASTVNTYNTQNK